jgi:hypothetical protein
MANQLETFRDMRRSHLRDRFKRPTRYEWPQVFGTPHGQRFNSAVVGYFVAGVFIHGEPWIVEGVLCTDPAGPPIVSRLIVEHHAARREVTGAVLRALPIAHIRDRALADLPSFAASRRLAVEAGIARVSEADAARAEHAAAEARKPRPGRRAKPDEHYERIAIRYLELLKLGRRDVLKALAAEESEREGRVIPRETIRDWVRKATRLEYLASGTPGRAKARPGRRLTSTRKET